MQLEKPKTRSAFWPLSWPPGRLLIGVLIVVTAASAVITWWVIRGQTSTTAAATPTPYQTATARVGSLRSSITGAGTLVAGTSVDLNFSTRGVVTLLNVGLGDAVSAGDELARLGGIESLEADAASAELALLEARQALKTLQNSGDLTLAQAYQDQVDAQTAYNEAQFNVQRTAYARCSDEVNQKNKAVLDHAVDRLASTGKGSDAYIDAESNYNTALANYNYCITYTTDEKNSAAANMELAASELKNAEAIYNRLKEAAGVDPDKLAVAEAQTAAAEAAYKLAQSALNGAVLTAPLDGIVTYLAAQKGSYVDDNLFITISDLNHPEVEVQVDEADLDQFLPNARAEVIFDALPDQVFNGVLIEVDPRLSSSGQYSTATGIVQLDLSAAEALKAVPLGLNGTVELITAETEQAVIIPLEALRDLGDGDYGVFVRSQDGTLRLRSVEIGVKDDAYVEITSGIQAGEIVSTGIVSTRASSN